MLYLYLDESGDLGFDFVNKRPSKFFTICIVAVKNNSNKKRIINGVRRTLRKKLNPKNKRKRMVQELEGSSTTFQIKKYFYKKVRPIDFEIYSLTLNKKRVYRELMKDKVRIYNWVSRLLMDNIDFSVAKNSITLIIDKSKSKPEIEEFNAYIQQHLKAKIDPKIPLFIDHLDSCDDYCINTVDMFAWGIRKRYHNDLKWYDVFKEKIKFDSLYLP
jgi:hypothetical protein